MGVNVEEPKPPLPLFPPLPREERYHRVMLDLRFDSSAESNAALEDADLFHRSPDDNQQCIIIRKLFLPIEVNGASAGGEACIRSVISIRRDECYWVGLYWIGWHLRTAAVRQLSGSM